MVFRWVVYMVTDVQIFDAWICDRKIVFRMGENWTAATSVAKPHADAVPGA